LLPRRARKIRALARVSDRAWGLAWVCAAVLRRALVPGGLAARMAGAANFPVRAAVPAPAALKADKADPLRPPAASLASSAVRNQLGRVARLPVWGAALPWGCAAVLVRVASPISPASNRPNNKAPLRT